MKTASLVISAAAVLGAASCSPGQAGPGGSSGVNKNLQCSAMISAASQLVAQQKMPPDPLVSEQGLLALMTYLNRYAIPAGLSEPDAFKELEAVREQLIAETEPGDILAEARTCIEKAKL